MLKTDKSFLNELTDDLKQQRDHLRLKIHLGGRELQDEFQMLDDKLAQLNTCYVPITNAVNTTARRLLDSLNQLGGEIEDGFCRIHKALQ